MKFKILHIGIVFSLIFNYKEGFCQNSANNSPSMVGHNYADSVIKSGADTVLFGIYKYDNGVVKHKQFVYWEENKQRKIKIFDVGTNSILRSFPLDSFNLSTEINFCIEHDIDTIKSSIKVKKWQSHDVGYFITLLIPGRTYHFEVRNYERKENMFDPRCQFVNLLDKKLMKLNEWVGFIR
jgi:hypothetical protein